MIVTIIEMIIPFMKIVMCSGSEMDPVIPEIVGESVRNVERCRSVK